MTPQEENIEAQRRATEEQNILTEANKAAADATEKARAANLKIENATLAVVGQFQKLLDVQLKYQVAMAKGTKGSAQFNDSVDLMTDTMQMAVTALSLLVPGGILIKGVVAGLTFLATNAMKSAAAMQKAANEQGDALKKAYDTMSKSGATASDGMTGLFKDVNKMRLNVNQLDAMAAVMSSSGKEMTAMGGTVYKARKEFANLVSGMGDYEKGMLNLGMSYDEQAEAAMGYMKLQANLSQGQQKDYGKLAGGMKKYLEETEALARVTGMNRKEQEAAQEKMLAQQRFGAKVQELRDAGQNEAADLLVSQMKKYMAKGEQFGQAFADLSTGMITTDAAMKGNMSTQGKMMEEANAITEGRMKTEKEANESFQETMTTVKDVHKSANALFQAGVGEDMFLPFKEGAEITKAANQNFAKQIDEASGEVKKLINSTDDVDGQLKRYNAMIKAQNDKMLEEQRKLNDKFVDTGVAAGGFMEKLTKAFEPLINMIGKVVDVWTPLASGLGDMLIGTISAVVKIMTGDVIGGLKEFKAGWDSAAKGLEETAGKWWDTFTGMWSTFGKNLLNSVEFVTGPLGPVFEKIGTGLTEMYDNFSKSLGDLSTKMGVWAKDTWESVSQSAAKFGADMLAGIEKITGPLGPVFDKVKTAFLGIPDDIKTGMAKFSDSLVSMVKDIWSKLTDLIPGLKKAEKFVGEAVDTGKSYANKGVETVKNVAGAVSDFFSPAGATAGAQKTATASAPTGGGAPAQTAPASAPAMPSGGGTPASVPAAPPARDGSGADRTANNTPAPGGKQGAGGGMDDAAAKAMIIKHEGIRDKPYQDSLKLWTVGIGHLIGDGKKLPDDWNRQFSQQEIMALFDKDYEEHKAAAASIIPNFDKMTSSMKAAFVDLTFNMGPAWINKWPNLQKQLKAMDIAGAIDNLTNSKWAGQVGNRAKDIVGMLRSGIQAKDGGVFDGPKSGYAATLHGNEAVIPLKDGAVPVSMSQEFNMTAANLGELVSQMRSNMAVQDRMITVLEEIRRAQTTTADNTGRMVAYASN